MSVFAALIQVLAVAAIAFGAIAISEIRERRRLLAEASRDNLSRDDVALAIFAALVSGKTLARGEGGSPYEPLARRAFEIANDFLDARKALTTSESTPRLRA